jgi:hypothetical protein
MPWGSVPDAPPVEPSIDQDDEQRGIGNRTRLRPDSPDWNHLDSKPCNATLAMPHWQCHNCLGCPVDHRAAPVKLTTKHRLSAFLGF